tara:strand:- start:563 stop:847 length:285 start_codon:yes stop_codon:yes gene_type:complete
MAFDKDSGKEAGKKSKRGQDTQLKELRECYSDILENNKGNIQNWIDKIAQNDPAKALELIIKLGSYVIPKPRTIELKQTVIDSEPTQITFFSTD